MKTGIPEFLPAHKQEELKQIIEVIETKFLKINTIILYGSYARGTWVEDRYEKNGTTFEYLSDYDLLLLMNNEKKAQTLNYQMDVYKEIEKLNLKTPVGLIFHGYPYVVKMLEEKRYFFCDIYKEGYILSNPKGREFEEPKKIPYHLRFKKAEEYFEESSADANRFLRTYHFHVEESQYDIKYLKNASFELHQATERLYMTIMLVFTDYRPKTHNLFKLNDMACDEDKKFREAFPKTTKEEKRLFKLLRDAYIGSRYHKNFKVTKEELEYLVQRVEVLKELTAEICKEKIEYFKSCVE